MKKYLIGLTFGCAICLQPTIAFGQVSSDTKVSGASISGVVMYQAPGSEIINSGTTTKTIGAVTTITGQITLPTNMYYSGSATVTYGKEGTENTANFRPTSLTITPLADSIESVDTNGSAASQTAAALKEAFTNDDLPTAISIIRAAGGANGLE
jgi:hypothetical protein